MVEIVSYLSAPNFMEPAKQRIENTIVICFIVMRFLMFNKY